MKLKTILAAVLGAIVGAIGLIVYATTSVIKGIEAANDDDEWDNVRFLDDYRDDDEGA